MLREIHEQGAQGQAAASGDIALRRVDLSVLQVDEHYQRDLVESKVREMVDVWRTTPERLANRPIEVDQRRDGTFWVVGGQHRVAAARRLGHQDILALVYHGQEQEGEAQFFRDSDRGLKFKALNRWKAELAGGQEDVVRITDELTKLGFWVPVTGMPVSGGTKDLWCINAPDALRTIAYGTSSRPRQKSAEFHPERVGAVLGLIAECWPHARERLHQTFLIGLGSFMLRYEKQLSTPYGQERLRLRLPGLEPIEYVARIRMHMKLGRLHTASAACQVFQEQYDAGLSHKTGSRLETGVVQR